MRVGQAADVEDEVGVERNAVLEAERLEHQGQAMPRFRFDELTYPLAQRVGLEAAGIDAMTKGRDRFEQLALAADRFGQRLILAAQGVAAPRFGVTLEQGLIVGMKEEEGLAHAVFLELAQLLRQEVDALAGTGVDRDCYLVDPLFGEHPHQYGEHDHRQVVYAVVACIFEQVQGDGLARA